MNKVIKVRAKDTTNSCPVCNEMARRDEALLDELQSAMFNLTAVDGYNDYQVRVLRVKASIRNAMRLMQGREW